MGPLGEFFKELSFGDTFALRRRTKKWTLSSLTGKGKEIITKLWSTLQRILSAQTSDES